MASLLRVPPPMSSCASRTVTSTPAAASSTAAASPLGPLPTTTAVVTTRPRVSDSRCPPADRVVRRVPARSRPSGMGPLGSHGCSATASATRQVPRSTTPRAASIT